jgi:superfamily I DNA/RNA helicase
MKTLIEYSTQEIISNTDRGVLVVANAGAGKTTLLVDYFFELISQGFNPEDLRPIWKTFIL